MPNFSEVCDFSRHFVDARATWQNGDIAAWAEPDLWR